MIRIPQTLFLLFVGLATNDVIAQREPLDLSPLGNNTWARFRPGWSLQVNDQCLYQFEFQFDHDPELPIGPSGFQGDCTFAEDRRDPVTFEDDGKLFLEPRRHWERSGQWVFPQDAHPAAAIPKLCPEMTDAPRASNSCLRESER